MVDTILSPEELQEVTRVAGDVSRPGEFAVAVQYHRVKRIAHLTSLLHPACERDPIRATQVNVVSHANVLEAAPCTACKRSSGAVLRWSSGARGSHAAGILANDAPHHPTSVYGATKSWAEFLPLHYARTWGVDALGLRLTVVYGPGRVRGASSFVNELIVKPALGEPRDWSGESGPLGRASPAHRRGRRSSVSSPEAG